ncbi:MAG: LysM peptidoglycan-binding domain-containing protein [Caldilineaceae bacterium]|nr:LysM peptidoglycan-binding domain-containing protein [Caldilineaceae bacterium]
MFNRKWFHALLVLLLSLALTVGGLPGFANGNAQAAPAASVEAQSSTYTVRAGDTLSSIARRFNTTVQALMTANRLTSTVIRVGQVLVIPGSEQPVRYQVQRGDTLSAIARRYGTTVQAIMTANGLTSTVIRVGQWLTIPTGATIPGAERIQFASGATSATLGGMVQPNGAKEYLFRAQAGQRTRIIVTTANSLVNLSVQGVSDGVPYKRASVGTPDFDMVLPMTQDYLLRVVNFSNVAASYSLFIQIDPLPNASTPIRIQFARGETSATVTGGIIVGEQARYILGARSGQTMVINISSVENNAVITVAAPNGQILSAADARSWSGVLPQTGDYLVTVGSVRGNASYNLVVTIQ